MGAAETAEASVGMLSTTDRLKEGKKFQVLCPSILSPESRAKLYGCYAVIAVLTAAVIALTVTLSAKEKQVSMKTTYAVCPRGWLGFGSKCFYFSEDLYNWILSKNFCMKVEAQLARFDNQEELDFLMKFKGSFDYWIGLHRNSSSDPWRWADNTEYNNSLTPIRGQGECVYLNEKGMGSARMFAIRRWICSKPNSYTLQCQIPFSPF